MKLSLVDLRVQQATVALLFVSIFLLFFLISCYSDIHVPWFPYLKLMHMHLGVQFLQLVSPLPTVKEKTKTLAGLLPTVDMLDNAVKLCKFSLMLNNVGEAYNKAKNTTRIKELFCISQ